MAISLSSPISAAPSDRSSTPASRHTSGAAVSNNSHWYLEKTNRIMIGVLIGCQLYALALAPWHGTWGVALLVGGGTLTATIIAWKGQLLGRHLPSLIAAAFMVMSALHIHQSHGTIEMHFSIFVLLALLIAYRDWRPIAVATIVIAAHHFLFFYMQINGFPVWVTEHAHWSMIFVHAGYVLVEAAALFYLAKLAAADAAEGQALASACEQLTRDDDRMDLTLKVNHDTEAGQSFDRFLGQLRTLVIDVQDRLRTLQQMGEALTRNAADVEQGAERQTSVNQQMIDAMQEMSTATATVAQYAQYAANGANTANELAADSGSAVQRISSSINTLKSDIDITSKAVGDTASQANDIDKVVDIIKDIAEQTNLLALNAAIEAARAGDHGRGFAVVADQVRSLSRRSSESTKEIQQLVKRLQQTSDSARQAMTRSQEAVGECLVSANEGTSTLQQLTHEISQMASQNDMIAASAQQQSVSGDQVVNNLQSVNEIASQNLKKARELSGISDSLHQLSDSLQHQLSRFDSGRKG
ncbi:methyl-accepting chemotaxis protein [Pseudohongiella sp. SYSU M77423]|uniref:methyl-accepting chemotaxis protein n=1 Tax=Pseudohongiella sp. SYSU M77423 TaxID=3042312 RepID=UPI00248188D5|nr:methyl-accepting chemotaxis protein [Pseudohongiella sp. SYSU M77423]MDH7942585.1 methyl-accepting chemotaxis protein [Pseudohongiella sp. SYSU M77423]